MINHNFYITIENKDRTGVVAGVTQIGPAHIARLKPIQDSIGFFEGEKAVAIAVADGVGSSQFSEEGSKYAVSILKDLLDQKNIDDIKTDDIKEFIINKWQTQFTDDLYEYATTLRYALISEKYIVVGSIGDGKTFLCVDGSYLQFETEDYFLNCTDALSMDCAYEKMIIERYLIQNNLSLALMTDGVANEIQVGKEETFLKYLDEIAGSKEMIQELGQWVEELNSANGDDKTIAFLKLTK